MTRSERSIASSVGQLRLSDEIEGTRRARTLRLLALLLALVAAGTVAYVLLCF